MTSLRKNIELLYLFVVAMQIVMLSHYFVELLKIPTVNYFYFESVSIYFNGHKRAELFEYIIGVVFIGLFFIGIVLGDKKLKLKARRYAMYTLSALTDFKNKKLLLSAFFLFILLPVLIYRSGGSFEGKLIIQAIGLFATIIFPFWNYFLRYKYDQLKRIKQMIDHVQDFTNVIFRKKSFYYVLLLLGFLQLGYLLYDPIVNQPKIINEYYNIPETTILETGETIFNTSHWNKYLFSAITHKTDVNELSFTDNCIKKSPSDFNISINNYSDTLTSWNAQTSLFCLNGVLELTAPKVILDVFSSVQNQNQLLAAPLAENSRIESTLFLKMNEYELRRQIHSRFMMHHHSFMLNPINEMDLNRDWSMINAQYGLGSSWIMQILLSHLPNGLSLDNWLKISYGFFFIYFILFAIIVYAVTQNFRFTSIITLTAIALINYRQYELLIMPPGDSPWRHILDIVVFYFIYQYAVKKNFSYYLIALILSIISILLNPQIGLMIFMATFIAGVYVSLQENIIQRRYLIVSSLIALVLAMISFVKFSSKNDLADYYLDGVLGFPISFPELAIIFGIFIVVYLLLFKLINNNSDFVILHIVWLVIYSQELILYVIWHYDHVGFFARSFIYLLTGTLLLYSFMRDNKRYKYYFYTIVTIVAIVFFVRSAYLMHKDKLKFEAVFKTHKTYEWDMDRAHIVSTMNPLYFQNGVDLIQEYSQGQNGIYIVSEYDNFLPFLAHKYSLMPFFDLKWYLITPKELDKSIKTLQANKPQYIFVDTGIERNLNNEIIDPKFPEIGYLYQESVWRAQRLKLLNEVFQSVASDYELVEKGYLISVYKRKDFNETY